LKTGLDTTSSDLPDQAKRSDERQTRRLRHHPSLASRARPSFEARKKLRAPQDDDEVVARDDILPACPRTMISMAAVSSSPMQP
jgi:hypothetical protein